MDAHADGGGPRETLERLVLAAFGAVALTADRVDELVDELAERGGLRRDDARSLVDDVTSRWRGDAVRIGERVGAGLSGVLHELGLVTREEWDELELRVAQVEHRLRLVENEPPRSLPPAV